MMNWEIFGYILSSSVLTAILSKLSDIWIHKDRFKKDYYKLIIQKRLDAYEYLHNYLNNFNQIIIEENDLNYLSVFNNHDEFEKVFIEITQVKSNDMWYSDKVVEKLAILNETLYNANNKIYKTEDLLLVALEYSPLIREIKNDISELHRSEILEIHDIKSFFKANKSHKILIELEK